MFTISSSNLENVSFITINSFDWTVAPSAMLCIAVATSCIADSIPFDTDASDLDFSKVNMLPSLITFKILEIELIVDASSFFIMPISDFWSVSISTAKSPLAKVSKILLNEWMDFFNDLITTTAIMNINIIEIINNTTIEWKD